MRSGNADRGPFSFVGAEMIKPLLTVHELAEMFGVSHDTVRRWYKELGLEVIRVNRMVRIEPDALARFLKRFNTAEQVETVTKQAKISAAHQSLVKNHGF